MLSARMISPLSSDGLLDQLKQQNQKRRNDLRRSSQAATGLHAARNDLVPRLDIIECKTADLKVPARKLRKLDPAHVQGVVGSISALGICRPILIDGQKNIIDGITVLEACRLLGITTVPCICVAHLGQTELRLLRLALNRHQEKGTWDLDELRVEIGELRILGASIEITGMTSVEIDQITIGEEALGIENCVLTPSDSGPSVSRAGDFFVLGTHRIGCGNSTEKSAIDTLMNNSMCGLILTDPPYNVPIVGHVSGGDHREFLMASGEMTDQQYMEFTVAWMSAARSSLLEGGLLASFIDWRGHFTIQAASQDIGLTQVNLVVWGKTNAGMGSLYRSQHELLPVFCVGKTPRVNNVELGKNGRSRSNLWSYPGASSTGSEARKGLQFHPTVKPVSMLADMLLDVTDRGDIVLDPFLGSGSTLMAAEKTGRRCFGLELDPLYVDVVIRRYEAMTGREAVLEITGETFAQLAKRRAIDAEVLKSFDEMSAKRSKGD